MKKLLRLQNSWLFRNDYCIYYTPLQSICYTLLFNFFFDSFSICIVELSVQQDLSDLLPNSGGINRMAPFENKHASTVNEDILLLSFVFMSRSECSSKRTQAHKQKNEVQNGKRNKNMVDS